MAQHLVQGMAYTQRHDQIDELRAWCNHLSEVLERTIAALPTKALRRLVDASGCKVEE